MKDEKLYSSKSKQPFFFYFMVLLFSASLIGLLVEIIRSHLSLGDIIVFIMVIIVSLFMVVVSFFGLSDQVTITRSSITVENHRWHKFLLGMNEKKVILLDDIKKAERRHSKIDLYLKENKKTTIVFQIWDNSTCKKCYMVINDMVGG